MADSEKPESPPQKPAKGKAGLVVWGLLGLIAAAAGFAIPQVLPKGFGGIAAPSEPTGEHEPGNAAEGADEDGDLAFVPFGPVIVNLDEGRLNRYLRLSITFAVDKPEREEVAKLIEARKVILKNWLITYLSDKGMEDIRGAAGQNRLRREINEYFNSVLFHDGYDRIRNVLFEEFNVQ